MILVTEGKAMMEDFQIELVNDLVGAVFPGLQHVFADEYGTVLIDLHHGMGVNYQNLCWLSKALGTSDINLERNGPPLEDNDDTWTPDLPCRLVCRFPGSYGLI